jgi:hypothetical protein
MVIGVLCIAYHLDLREHHSKVFDSRPRCRDDVNPIDTVTGGL